MHYKMMEEYGVDWPFWNLSDSENEHPYLCEEEDPPLPHLPEELALRIRRWTRQFNDEYIVASGWPTEQMGREHAEEGRKLYAEVVAALPEDTVDFHP